MDQPYLLAGDLNKNNRSITKADIKVSNAKARIIFQGSQAYKEGQACYRHREFTLGLVHSK